MISKIKTDNCYGDRLYRFRLTYSTTNLGQTAVSPIYWFNSIQKSRKQRKVEVGMRFNTIRPPGYESVSGPLFYEARSWHWAYPSLHPSGVVHRYQSGWTSRLWLGAHWLNKLSSCVCNSALITTSYKYRDGHWQSMVIAYITLHYYIILDWNKCRCLK